MSRRVFLSGTAIDDLVAVGDAIADRSGSEDLGEAFADRLLDRCQRIALLPGTLGTARPELASDLRSTPHKDYVIFFRYVEDELEVVRILHGSRDFKLQSFGSSDDEQS